MGLLRYLLLLLLCQILRHCVGDGQLLVQSSGKVLTRNQTLLSASGTFVLGFFNPGNLSDGNSDYYLGIWYSKIPKGFVVWVANREQPLTDPNAYLTVTEQRNLVLMNSNGTSVWSTDVPDLPSGTVAKLLETGNLVLTTGNLYHWESFAHSTDTYLPGMEVSNNAKAEAGQKFVAWKNANDPFPGDVSAGLSASQIILWRGTDILWTSGAVLGGSIMVPLGPGASLMVIVNRVGDNLTFSNKIVPDNILLKGLVESSGEIMLKIWNDGRNDWDTVWRKPSDFCDFYGRCGAWGVCNGTATPSTCNCLLGFIPKNKTQWGNKNFSGGCIRRDPPQFSRDDQFLQVEKSKLPNGFSQIERLNETECKNECLSRNQCTAYSFVNASGVLESSICLVWEGDIIDLQIPYSGEAHLNIRFVASELDLLTGKGKKSIKLLLPLLLSVGLLFVGGILFFLFKKLGLPGKKRVRQMSRSQFLEFSDTFETDRELDVHLVDFKSIQDCTENFSEKNKVGEGGFGAVYKGTLPNGRKIAVKRLSRGSGQGQREFTNEVRLIAKLQHKNLVRLLGWCIHEEEMILIYEFMENNSLDKHIFEKPSRLGWEKRFSIIVGIADGLLYLHQHSRMHVIHRDLKTSNILLDGEMNPKISDFGLAKIIQIKETEGKTRKVVGTLGYMSPEYALQGVFSEKSDVFSFGVIVLEVITGKRSLGNYPGTDPQNIIGYAWKLWSEGRAVELLDPTIYCSDHVEKALKYIHVALLCIEEDAADRPTTHSVLSILTRESCALPSPKHPGFPAERIATINGVTSHILSVNDMTEMTLEAR